MNSGPQTPASIRRSKLRDANKFARIIRSEDAFELQAATGKEPAQVLIDAFSNPGSSMFSVLSGKRVVAMFGVTTVARLPTGLVGAPWFVCADELFEKHRFQFIRESKDWIEALSSRYALLENVVLEANQAYVQWIKRTGFSLIERLPSYGPLKQPFWRFTLVCEHERTSPSLRAVTPLQPRISASGQESPD